MDRHDCSVRVFSVFMICWCFLIPKPPEATTKTTRMDFQNFVGKNGLRFDCFNFVEVVWWSVGGSGAAWGSFGVNQRFCLTRVRIICLICFDIFVGRCGIDPGVVWDHFCILWQYPGTPTCHAGGAGEGGPHVEWHVHPFFKNSFLPQTNVCAGSRGQKCWTCRTFGLKRAQEAQSTNKYIERLPILWKLEHRNIWRRPMSDLQSTLAGSHTYVVQKICITLQESTLSYQTNSSQPVF